MSVPSASTGSEQALTEYIQIFRRRKWWMVVAVVLVTAAGAFYTYSAPKEYTASAELLAQASVSTLGVLPTLAQTQLDTWVYLIGSPGVRQDVRSLLHVTGPIPGPAASLNGEASVITVSVTSKDPALAAKFATGYVNAFANYELAQAKSSAAFLVQTDTSEYLHYQGQLTLANKDHNTQLALELTTEMAVVQQNLTTADESLKNPTSDLSVLGDASVPVSPSSPDTNRDLLIAFLGGLLVAGALALVIDYRDDRLRTPADAQRLTDDLPAVAAIPMLSSWKKRKDPFLVSNTEPTSSVVEAYWSLRASVNFLAQERSMKSVLITSPAEGEGKTTTLANLGVVAAKGGQRTVVVSCDLRRPRLSTFYGQASEKGFMSVLSGESTLQEAVTPAEAIPNLWFLDTGPLPHDPHRALAGPGAQDIIDELCLNFDLVLIDSPPVLPVADAIVLGQMADATLLIATVGQTKKRQLRRAVDILKAAHVEPVGLILNEVTKDGNYGYGYGYGYYGSYQQADKKKAAHKKERVPALSAVSANGGSANGASTSYAGHDSPFEETFDARDT